MMNLEFALLILRLVIGLLFMGHGLQKLFGWFGGHGLEGTSGFFESLNVHPAKAWAVIAGLSEALGGLGLFLGFLTPIAAAAIIGVMLMAIIKVHWQNGLWVTNNGMEYTLVNIAIAAVLGLARPGAYALDTMLNWAYPIPLTFIVALVIIVLGVIAGAISNTFIGEPTAHMQS